MRSVPLIAETPAAIADLIAHWREVALTEQPIPNDLSDLVLLQTELPTDAHNAPLLFLADEREAFERRHAFWLKTAPGRYGDEATTKAEDLTDHPGCGVRHHRPAGKSEGDIVFLHGGGWVLGSTDTHHRFCQILCDATSMNVYSLHYPRAPEHSSDTILQAIDLAVRGIKTAPTLPRILAGDSAGATLGLLTALRSENPSEWDGFAWLYGPLDPTLSLRSHRVLADFGSLTKDKMAWYWAQFLGEKPPHLLFDPTRLSRLPACFLACGGQDLLLDDTLNLAQFLTDNSIAVTLHVQAGMPHGYFQMTDHVKAAQQSAERFFDWVERLSQKR
ncbi:alpha/beta hydrolase fold domain-containing protein [Leisingera sp.]|uniref:alpha/beta hydrolase fold domain-containing protein n=1 Tax=Leisingera sp. TaxID=1879318 RepID=UPI003A8D79E9